MNNSPILVTGSHRSGTTWVGNILKQSSNVYYIHEPFDPNGITRNNMLINIWYKYLRPNKKHQIFYILIDSLIQGKYQFQDTFHFRNALPIYDFRNPNGINTGKFNYNNFPWRLKQLINSILNQIRSLNTNYRFRGLIKDPIAIFSAEWLYNNFNTQNLILIRHPAAFVSSLKRLNWHFDFNNFLKQNELMEDHLLKYKNQMELTSGNITEEASLLWVCIHSVIKYYQENYPSWVFKRHEDISRNPLKEFENIFQLLDLEFNKIIKEKIIDLTSSKNPSEVTKHGKIHQLKRDSLANIYNWKNRLSKNEIDQIKRITKATADHFYSDDEW